MHRAYVWRLRPRPRRHSRSRASGTAPHSACALARALSSPRRMGLHTAGRSPRRRPSAHLRRSPASLHGACASPSRRRASGVEAHCECAPSQHWRPAVPAFHPGTLLRGPWSLGKAHARVRYMREQSTRVAAQDGRSAGAAAAAVPVPTRPFHRTLATWSLCSAPTRHAPRASQCPPAPRPMQAGLTPLGPEPNLRVATSQDPPPPTSQPARGHRIGSQLAAGHIARAEQ